MGVRAILEIVKTTPGLRGGILSSYDGQLLARVGDIDGEIAARVIAAALRVIWRTCENIGFGAPTNWGMTIGDLSWYVCHGPREVVAVLVGVAVDRPGATARRLSAAFGGGAS